MNNEKQTLTKEQVIDGINKFIANNPGTSTIDAINETIDANGTNTIISTFGVPNISAFFLQLVTYYPQAQKDLEQAARHHNPFFITDTANFLKRLNTDTTKTSYLCNVFMQVDKKNVPQPVKMPNGTMTYIGARTHRGKTTAMVSIAVDALEQGKVVYFYTNEESTDTIIMRLVKAFLYTKHKNNSFIFEENERKKNFDLVEKIDDDDTFIAAALLDTNPKNPTYLTNAIRKSFEYVTEKMRSHQLTIIDGIAQRTFDDLIDSFSLIEKGNVVLLDYIQHIRKPDKKGGADYKEIQFASQAIADVASKRDFVMIAGAQLSRKGSNVTVQDDRNKADLLDESLFRESGDIEQDANIIIEIGQQRLKDDDTDARGYNTTRFYEILKQRGHAPDAHQYRIMDNARFSLFECEIMDDNLHGYPVLQFFVPKEYKEKPEKTTARKPAAKGASYNGHIIENPDF